MLSNDLIICCPLLLLYSVFPNIRSFPLSWLFASGGQSIGASASASVLPMNIQGWFPLGSTGLISLQSKGISRVFSGTTIQKHQFFSSQPSLWSNSPWTAARQASLSITNSQTHVHWVGDAIQPSYPLSSPSPPTFNLSQHQGLFKWVSSSHQVAKVLEFQLQHQTFQWTVGWYWALFQSLLHLFNLHSNPMRLIILLSPLDRWENWVSIIYPRPYSY